jgi:hypothetical protein
MIARIKNVLLGLIVGAIGGALYPILGRGGPRGAAWHSKGAYLMVIIDAALICAVAFGVVNPRPRDKTPDSSKPSESAGNSPHEDV